MVLWGLGLGRTAAGAELAWSAPQSCPTEEDVQRALEEAIHQPLADAEPLRFEVRVELEVGGAARVVLTVQEASASAKPKQRVIQAKDCVEAKDAAIVAMALALGAIAEDDSGVETDDAQRDGPPTDDADPSESARPKTRSSPAEPSPARSTASASPLLLGTEASFVLDSGSLPNLAPGAEAGVSLGWRQVGARVTGVVLPKDSVTVEGDAGGSFTLLAASLAACGSTADAVLSAETCAGCELGRMSGSGFGIREAEDASSWWVAPRVDVSLRVRMGETIAGFLRGGAAVPQVRERFRINNVTPMVHRTDSAVWRLGVGLRFEL